MNAPLERTSDILIVGGGLAGLTLALQLRQACPDQTVTVLEQRRHPVPEATHKVGESSVEIGAHYFADVLGLRDHLEACQLPKLGLRYFFDSVPEGAPFSERVEFGGNVFFPAGSFQIDRGRFENHLGDVCRERGVDLQCGVRVRSITPDAEAGHGVEIRDADGQVQRLRSRWLIDASGRTGLLRTPNGWTREVPHRASSMWFRVKEKICVDDWSDDPAWRKVNGVDGRRWLSTNHLMGEGYWVWLIPLASGSTSIGIVADETVHPSDSFYPLDRALDWLDAHEPVCGRVVRALKDQVQDVLIERNFSHDCHPVFQDRLAVTGEAGLFLDPFYSPGSDFIAMSNTFITALVQREVRGRPVGQAAKLYDDIYHLYFANNLKLYHPMYPVFGNARVMPLKVLWDFAYYWAIPASLFFHERLCDIPFYAMYRDLFERMSTLNGSLQDLFRHWHRQQPNPKAAYHFVDVTRIPFMRDLNTALMRDIASEDYPDHFLANIRILETLAGEILTAAREAGVTDPGDAAWASVEPRPLDLLLPWREMVGEAFGDPT